MNRPYLDDPHAGGQGLRNAPLARRSRIPLRYVWRGLKKRRISSLLTLLTFGFVSGVWIILQSMISTMQQTLTDKGPVDRYVILSSEATAENQSRLDRGELHTLAAQQGVRLDRDGRPLASRELATTTYLDLQSADDGTGGDGAAADGAGTGGAGDDGSAGAAADVAAADGAGWQAQVENSQTRQPRRQGSFSNRIQVNVRGVTKGEFERAHPGWRLEAGRLFGEHGQRECIIGAGLARSTGLQVGSSIELWEAKWQVTGIFSEQGTPFESEIWADSNTMAMETGRTHTTSMWLLAETGDQARALVRRISAQPRRDVSILKEGDYFGARGAIGQELRFLVYFTSGILAIGAILSGLNTLYASLSSRSKELATLRAIGFESGSVRRAVLLEGILLSLAGWLLASVLSVTANGVGFRSMVSGIGFVTFSLRIDPGMILSAGVLALAMGSAGSWVPALRSTRIPIIKALSGAVGAIAILAPLPAPFTPQLHAQSLSPRQHELTLDSALILSLASEPQLLSLRLQLEDARLQQERYWVEALPDLTFGAEMLAATQAPSYPRFNERGELELVEQGKPYEFRSTLELSSSVNDWRRGSRRMQAEGETIQMLLADLETGAWETELALEEAFHEWEHLHRLEQGYRRLLSLKDSLSVLYRDLYEQGSASVLLPADGELEASLVWVELGRVESARQNVLDRVAMLTGLDPMHVTGLAPLQSEPWSGLLDRDPEEWIRLALESHPSLERLRSEATRAQHYQALSHIQATPELTLFGRMNYFGPKETFGADIPGAEEWLGQVGVRVRYGFRSPVLKRIESRQWDVRRERLESEIKATGTLLRRDLWTLARKASEEFNRTLQARLECGVHSQRILMLREEIDIGSSQTLDLLRSQSQHTESWIRFHEARFTLIRTILQVERTIGRRLAPDSASLGEHQEVCRSTSGCAIELCSGIDGVGTAGNVPSDEPANEGKESGT